jgi:type I site-specific restriction endonuclease
MKPRHYQSIVINRNVEAIANEQKNNPVAYGNWD